ncbi:lysin A, L-Ala-D-Glu peptidase domain [Gordonia phage Aphelion]|uniref:Lysin A, L-Ala-D-Glu peptidase domain n=3 Tax=Smoothievirus TaxID=1982557 RepID=A0A410TD16_9CAUD|nr:endolysin [Gordonia phage ClubL]YP_009276163.1 endolysin [Gordonia phage Bachita]YP_009281206.1 endolysin [Gordonia phage Cucurbita]AUE23619.1 lysin A, L-Ala-D-Glu peptidase domain [Gordonia phage Toniann]QAU06915.1 lysin A, L-Ala-D-Glu peptidase domain [Gordonia phage Aphelion]ANA86548.1 lysin A, L-Ala-D-Glu peptidase domain [Gordonia phage ClubL]ANA86728.1 lysin A, L-Ala-D-Glu peptidase domain [Gordonia phage Bachita]AOE44278.1 lysin A, L-Ala-D-Glu peptidase domain [Gordonia phage Cucur
MSFRRIYGLDWSENGWRMCNSDETVVVDVAGMRVRIRSGYAAEALGAWMRWYHENVERIDLYKPLDDWGWSATNDVASSNHLSGTAVDINATQYPWGLRTMSAARKAKIREGLKLFEGVIFWGADWSRADEMHYQLNHGTSSGTGASQKLIDFCNRRIRNGRLVTEQPPKKEDGLMAEISDKDAVKVVGAAIQMGEAHTGNGARNADDKTVGPRELRHPDFYNVAGNERLRKAGKKLAYMRAMVMDVWNELVFDGYVAEVPDPRLDENKYGSPIGFLIAAHANAREANLISQRVADKLGVDISDIVKD